jgi:hypothetical protein
MRHCDKTSKYMLKSRERRSGKQRDWKRGQEDEDRIELCCGSVEPKIYYVKRSKRKRRKGLN